MRRGTVLDNAFTTKEGLVSTVKLEGSWGCSDHGVVEIEILIAVSIVHSKIATFFRKCRL